jgi:transketolase
MRDAFIARLFDLAKADERICLITGDLGFGVLDKFAAMFPKQYLNAGVAEQNMTGLATGMALDGRIAFTYSIANFPTLRCLEQLRNDAAYHDANVKVVSIGGGFSYGALGMSHHATEDLAILRALPQITVTSPGCLWEAERVTESLVDWPGTCYLRLDKSDAGRTDVAGEKFQFGKIRTIRNGSDAAIFATGGILGVALDASEELGKRGYSVRVLSVHSLRPFDIETALQVCANVKVVTTLEEHGVGGGLGGLLAETCLESGVVPSRFFRFGLRGGFSSIVGSQSYLRKRHGLDSGAVVEKICALIQAG